MAGTRADGIIDQPTLLQFWFYKNGVLYDVDDFQKVEIYPTLADAQAGTNIIETIDAVDINHIDTGKYSYTAASIGTSGTYYDRVYIIPESGGSLWTPSELSKDINPFYLRKESYGSGTPGTVETCRVTLNIFDYVANVTQHTKMYLDINKDNLWYNDTHMITKDKLPPIKPDSTGKIEIDLVETDTLSAENGGIDVYYTITIGTYEKRFTIPSGTLDATIKGLPEYQPFSELDVVDEELAYSGVSVSDTIDNLEVVPGSLTFKVAGTSINAKDNSNGDGTGDIYGTDILGVGSINYYTGVISFSLNSDPSPDLVEIDYKYYG